MKLMRSRFRLIALLLACVFLLTAVVCAASVLKQAGVTLPSGQQALSASEQPFYPAQQSRRMMTVIPSSIMITHCQSPLFFDLVFFFFPFSSP